MLIAQPCGGATPNSGTSAAGWGAVSAAWLGVLSEPHDHIWCIYNFCPDEDIQYDRYQVV